MNNEIKMFIESNNDNSWVVTDLVNKTEHSVSKQTVIHLVETRDISKLIHNKIVVTHINSNGNIMIKEIMPIPPLKDDSKGALVNR